MKKDKLTRSKASELFKNFNGTPLLLVQVMQSKLKEPEKDEKGQPIKRTFDGITRLLGQAKHIALNKLLKEIKLDLCVPKTKSPFTMFARPSNVSKVLKKKLLVFLNKEKGMEVPTDVKLQRVQFHIQHATLPDEIVASGSVIMPSMQIPFQKNTEKNARQLNRRFMELGTVLFDKYLKMDKAFPDDDDVKFTFDNFIAMYADVTPQTVRNWRRKEPLPTISEEARFLEIEKKAKGGDINSRDVFFYLKYLIREKVCIYIYIYICIFI